MELFDVPIRVTILAEDYEQARFEVSNIVDTTLSDAQESYEIVRWELGEPQESTIPD